MSTKSETSRLMPEFTKEDFDTERPYEWLYQLQNTNKFLAAQALNRLSQKAAELGVKATQFKAYWKAYLQSMAPQSIAGRNETNFTDQPVTMQCGEYVCDDRGVRKFGHMGEEIEVLSHPLLPVCRIEDMDTGAQKIQLAYSRQNGQWKTTIVPRETAATATRVVSLAANGLAVNSENARDVVRFLSDVESMNYEQMPVRRSTSHLGWLSQKEFAPYADDVVFDGDSEEFETLYDGMKPHGDSETWYSVARSVRAGKSVPARIALAAAFAAPLVKPLGALSFFVHLWGLQGSGKTVALMLGASVWGNPAMGQMVKTFSGTKVSFEMYSSFCGNVPVFLDELQVIADRQTFDDIIYALCEGVSKGRGAKGGGLQKQKRWATCFVTTGEMPIVKNNSGGGAAVRTIEINYAGEPFFDDARETAALVQEHYGHAGQSFITAVTERLDDVRTWQKQFYRELSGSIQDKQVLSASVILAADRLADEALFHDGRALTVSDIAPYLVTKEEADQNARCYNWLIDYLNSNPARFRNPEDNNGELWGVIEDNVYYINRAVFNRIVENGGFSAKAFLMWAKRNGKIEAEDHGVGNGNNRLTKRKRISGRNVQCVALKTEEQTEQNENQKQELPPSPPAVSAQNKQIDWQQVDDEPLPF